MTHREMDELYELYALGVLEEPESAEIHQHLDEGCAYCSEQLHTALAATASLLGLAEAVNAPRHLRRRVMASIAPKPAPARSWIFAVGGLSTVSLGLLGLALWTGNQTQSLHHTVDTLTGQRDDLRAQVQTLSSERTQLAGETQTTRNTVEALTGQRNDLRQRTAALSRQRTQARNQTQTLTNRITQLTSEITQLSDARNGLQAQVQTLSAERAQAVSQTQNLRGTVETLNTQLNSLRGQVQALNVQRNTLLAQRGELQSVVNVVANSNTRTLQFGGANNIPQGRVFLPPDRGVVFVGLQLPEIGADRTLQLWLVPAKGAPRSAGLFRPGTTGEAVYASQVQRADLNTAAVAVSVEPRQGSTAPTTKPIIVVPVPS